MSRSILAKKILHNQHLVFSRPGLSSINGSMINNQPQTAWLVRNKYDPQGEQALELTFVEPADDINVIKGVYIQIGKDGILIDGNIDDVNNKLGGCCGDDADVTQNYPTGLPAYQPPVAKTYTVVRTDDGTLSANEDALFAYSGTIDGRSALPNSFVRVSRNSGAGTTTYSFQAYKDPSPKGTDVITETAIVITSNTYATALAGSNVYNAQGVVDGEAFNVKGTAATLASLVTALNTNPATDAMGTWTAGTNQVILTTTVRDAGVVVLGQTAP